MARSPNNPTTREPAPAGPAPQEGLDSQPYRFFFPFDLERDGNTLATLSTIELATLATTPFFELRFLALVFFFVVVFDLVCAFGAFLVFDFAFVFPAVFTIGDCATT